MISMFGTTVNNLMAKDRESRARNENFRLNEIAAENADARTRSLYSDLYSPQAQIEQLKKANLSPSLFYGDSGGISGQTGAMGGGSGNISPNIFGVDALQGAQLKLLQAQTENVQADTDEKRGNTPQSEANIAKTWADVGAINASKTLQEAQTQYTKAQENLTWHNAAIAAEKSMQAYYEALDAGLVYQFNQETYNTRKNQESAKLALILADKAEKDAKVKLSEQQVKELETKIASMVEEISMGWEKIHAESYSAYNYGDYIKEKSQWIEREMELKAEELGIEKTRVWTNFATDMTKNAVNAVETAMLVKPGRGGSTTPPIQSVETTSAKYSKKGDLQGYSKTRTNYRR